MTVKTKTALVTGAGGFIGSNTVKRLKKMGYWVRGVDLKYPEFEQTEADDFIIMDLRDDKNVIRALTLDSINEKFELVFQYAADMGGAMYIFSGDHDADVMENSAQINLNFARHHDKINKMLWSSSACIYPFVNQLDPDNPSCAEDTWSSGIPDSPYGFEKIFSEQLYQSYRRNYGLNVKIVRFHNVFGTNGTYEPLKSKAPAATCVKVINALENGEIEVWGTGKQTRSFINISDALDGVFKLLDCDDFHGPVNIGSEEMISINDLTKMVIEISGRKDLTIKNIPSNAIGVNGRNSENTLCRKMLNWEPKKPLREGMEELYSWIYQQIKGEPFRK
jgi:nucleoside-diphosphate-sugar epimerase